jgi:hypothetical protein
MINKIKTHAYINSIWAIIIMFVFIIIEITLGIQNESLFFFLLIPFICFFGFIYYLFYAYNHIDFDKSKIIFHRLFFKPVIHEIKNIKKIIGGGVGNSYHMFFENEKNEVFFLSSKDEKRIKMIIKELADKKREILKDDSQFIIFKEKYKMEERY